jgi:DNA-binding IscR family transcriptional regulator
MARKTINVDWDSVTAALTNGQMTKIEQFATQYGISRPTAKKMLAEKYGNAIVFNRGRAGGIVFNPSSMAVTA